MPTTNKPRPDIDLIRNWLRNLHGKHVQELQPLAGGFWSSAYRYHVDGNDLVLRLGESKEGFQIDAEASQFGSAQVPIPEVLEIGDGLDLCYAISRFHPGEFIETRPATEADRVGHALHQLLTALREVPAEQNQAVIWYDPRAREINWHEWLRSGLLDHEDSSTSGWRTQLAQQQDLYKLFQECEARIEMLLPDCPERRDLVHGDLLHQNVLISENVDQVTGIFSWKCSARGDFLYDVAWCTLWSPWHPCIAAANLWQRTLEAQDLSQKDLYKASLRHHCYELQIAASHFAWYTWTRDTKNMATLADITEKMLERGPLSA